MPICRPSISRMALRPLIASVLPLLLAQTASAQGEPDRPGSPDAAQQKQVTPPSPGAAAQGKAAMDRLQRAITQQSVGTPVPGAPMALPSLPDAMRRRAFEGLRKRPSSPAMEERARRAAAKGAADLASERDAMARKLAQALGLEAPDVMAMAKATAPSTGQWVPVLFASSSMPVSTLRTYAAQLERVGGVMAFRGMPGGLTRVAPMAKLSAQILRLDPGCDGPGCAMRNLQLIVDPILFRVHGVTAVPGLAMVPGDPAQPYCEREDEATPRASHIIYGDAALAGLLAEYARLGGREEVRDARARLDAR